jgi:hypothetical protein
MIRVDLPSHSSWDDDEPVVMVETVDATDTTRVYRVRLTDGRIDGDRLMAGRRIVPPTDDDDPRTTSRVFDAARRTFEERGFDVFGGGEA